MPVMSTSSASRTPAGNSLNLPPSSISRARCSGLAYIGVSIPAAAHSISRVRARAGYPPMGDDVPAAPTRQQQWRVEVVVAQFGKFAEEIGHGCGTGGRHQRPVTTSAGIELT